jgi:predicted phage tail protein
MIVNYDISTDTTPPTSSVNPLPVFSTDSFIVGWTGQDNPGGSGISHYDVMYQVNGGTWVNWLLGTTDTQASFVGGANGSTYGFRVRAVDNAGNVQPWSSVAQASTTVDTIAPNATISPLLPPFTCEPSFTISWVGSDNGGGSGLRTSPGPFDLQYQIDGGDWLFWLVGTSQTSVQATGAVDGETYGFRVRATDQAGNVQPWSPTAQSSTTASFGPPTAQVNQFQPFYTSANVFSVSWGGAANNCATLASFDIRYRLNQGSWTNWRTGTTAVSDIFDVSSMPDGTYTFQARARDTEGNLGPWSEDLGEAFIFVQRDPPFPALPLYLPMTPNQK